MKPRIFAACAAPLLVVAGALLSAVALAQEPPPPPPPPPPAANGPGHPGGDHDADLEAGLEAGLEAARHRLEEDARQVAELSSRLGAPALRGLPGFDGPFGRAIIGVQLDPATGKDGAHVVEVSPGGPADEAGIRAGDVIVAVNGKEIKGEDAARQVVKSIRGAKPDSKLKLRVLRAGKTQDFTVTARPGPHMMELGGPLPDLPNLPDMPPGKPFFTVRSPWSNMALATLTPRLGKYFGTDKGVLVVRAPPDGALKLEDGDVIVAIDGRQPISGSHATRILGSYQPGEKVTLRIVRDHKTVDLDTTVPEPPARPDKTMIFQDGPPGKVVISHREDES